MRAADLPRLLRLSARLLGGRRYWLLPLAPLAWPAFQTLLLATGAREQAITAGGVQNFLLGLPLAVLGILLGVRVIAGEIDRRSLEIAYTVPGGAGRVWLARLAASLLLLAVSEALLALWVFLFLAPVTLGMLYGAFQVGATFLVCATGLAALARGEVAGMMLTGGLLTLVLFFSGFRLVQRISPFWNPAAHPDMEPALRLAWTVQNRLGYLLVIAGLVALAFLRAERREKLLGG